MLLLLLSLALCLRFTRIIIFVDSEGGGQMMCSRRGPRRDVGDLCRLSTWTPKPLQMVLLFARKDLTWSEAAVEVEAVVVSDAAEAVDTPL